MKCPICKTEMIDDKEAVIPDLEGNPMGVIILKCPKGCNLSDISKWDG